MSRVLIFQFRTDTDREHDKHCFLHSLGNSKTDVDFVNVPDADFDISQVDINKYTHIIFGGSGAYDLTNLPDEVAGKIHSLKPLIKQIVSEDRKALFICFGHQLLAQTLGGMVEKNQDMAESGGFAVYLNEVARQDALFSQMPTSFQVCQAHKDSVTASPQNAVLLGSSERCKNQIFKYGKNVYSIQFHPELTKERIKERFLLYPEYLKDKRLEDIMENFGDISESAEILKLFTQL